jgi:hypothetical protein
VRLRERAGRLAGHDYSSDFRRFWLAQTISLFGTEVTSLALPLTAALTLQASAGEMAVMAALRNTPHLLFGLMAGVWVDRARRRRILLGSDVASALLLASIPAAAFAGRLRLEQLYLVAFGMGAIGVV